MSGQDTSETPESASGGEPAFSLVIPMKNEAGNVQELLQGCVDAATPLGPFEIIVTDDASTDETPEILRGFQTENPDVALHVLTHSTSAGQSAAVHNAVRASSAPLVCTMDGDGQNPPDQIPLLLKPLLDRAPDSKLALIAGQRAKRQDTFAKRYASKFANGLRSRILKDGTRDTGCGHKAFRRDAFLQLPYFDHMHRYLPALFQRDGWEVGHVDVRHQERGSGASKYNNFGRAMVGISDLAGVAWLIRRRKKVPAAEAVLTRQGEGA